MKGSSFEGLGLGVCGRGLLVKVYDLRFQGLGYRVRVKCARFRVQGSG